MVSTTSRRHVLRQLSLGGAAVAAPVLLGVRGSSANRLARRGASTPVPTPFPGATLEWWSRETYNAGARIPVLEERLAAFDTLYGTETSAQFLAFQDSLQKTQAAIATGTTPDIGQQGQEAALQFAVAGHLLPVNDVFAELQDQFLPLQRDAFVAWEGTTYAIPWYLETRALFYHKDLFEEAGVQAPTTWQEWLDAATALTKGDEQYGMVMSAQSPALGQLLVPLAASAGTPMLDANCNVSTTSDGFRAAMQLLADFYSMKTMPEGTPTYSSDDARQLFTLKKVAMFVTNSEVIDATRTQNPSALETLGAVPIPVRRSGDISRAFMGGFTLFIFQQSENPEAAKELVKFLFEPEWYRDYLARTAGAALPVTKAVADQGLFQQDPLIKTLVDQLPNAVRYGGPLCGNLPWLGEVAGQGSIDGSIVDVWTGTRTVEEALTYMETEIKKLADQA